MASTAKIQSCDYLYPYPSSQAFASDRAEFDHINEQISSLDNHISQLTTLRNALHRRSCQLHNLLSPSIRTLPIEVLSYIFQQLVNPGCYDYPYIERRRYQECLGQAFVLGSVSSHFRHVALGTPELWTRVALNISNIKAIGSASYFLRHCIALTHSVNISVYDKLEEEAAPSTVNILLTPDVMQKVKTFELYESANASNHWIDKVKASCCPLLDTLGIRKIREPLRFDLGTLTTVTRLSIEAPYLDHSSFVPPPSLQYLNIHDVPQQALVSLLYQSPNLVECIVDIERGLLENSNADMEFTKPLSLVHLKRLTCSTINAIETSSSVENLRLPSLEFLELEFSPRTTFSGSVLLCHNVLATLTTLMIYMGLGGSDDENLYRLCQIPFAKLKNLEFHCFNLASFSSIMRALSTLNRDEPNDSRTHCIPTLQSILLFCMADMQPHHILDLLKGWKLNETIYVHINVYQSRFSHRDWSPNLREELRSIAGSRQIAITWGNCKIQDGSLGEAIIQQ